MKKLVIAGAAGHLGTIARRGLGHLTETLRISDISDMGEATPGEESVLCNLTDKDAVESLVRDCDGILHLGGCSNENTWTNVRTANMDAVFNLYEAARKKGHPRILFASSNHVVGCYKQNDEVDAAAQPRPDSLYGVSKVFSETLARMYFDKFGIETASVHIVSCFAEPEKHRMLSTWLSPADFCD